MGRRDKFRKAKEAEARAREANNSNFEPIEYPQYLALEKDRFVIFRMVGNVPSDRQTPSDPKVVLRSLVKDDNGGWFTLNWHEDRNDAISRLVKVVAKYDWDNDANNGKGGPVYDNDGCPLLKQILTNNQDSKFRSGWDRPTKWVVANVIDRMDEWCKENNHTKILAKEVRESGDKLYATYGITNGMWNTIWDDVCSAYDEHFEDFDLAIRRFSKETNGNWSMVLHGTEDRKKLAKYEDDDQDGIEYGEYVVDGELSKKEEGYERYNIDDHPLFRPTSYTKFLSRMGKFVKKVDAKYDTTFFGELTDLSKDEKAKWDEEKKEKESESRSSDRETHDEEPSETPAPEEKEAPVRRTRERKAKKEEAKDFSVDDLDPEFFEGIGKLTDEEKEAITGVEGEGEDSILTFNTDDVAECPNCGLDVPLSMDTCPYCATEFE